LLKIKEYTQHLGDISLLTDDEIDAIAIGGYTLMGEGS